MLRVPIKKAVAGMKLALPVLHPQRGTILLTEGFALSQSLIRKLDGLNIHDIWIEYPNTEQIKQYVSPDILRQQSELIGTMAELFDSAHHDAYAQIDFSDFRKTIQGLIESLVAEPIAASYIVELGGSAQCSLRHASEVCFLSVLLGLKLQGYLVQQRKRLRPIDARNVVSLGLGAMLHDIGMTALDQETRDRYEQTRNENDLQWRKHVAVGHKMISGSISPSAAGVVLHHHQHFDGSGFPTSLGADGRSRGLAGEEIHVFSRIVCVANHFDRLRHAANGIMQPRVRVLKAMLAGDMTSRFDPVILATLPLVVPAYPPGSVVTLSNSERAIVLDWHPQAPCQPTVQVMQSGDDQLVRADEQPVRYDLRERSNLLIIEHDSNDVRNDNFRLISGQDDGQKNAA